MYSPRMSSSIQVALAVALLVLPSPSSGFVIPAPSSGAATPLSTRRQSASPTTTSLDLSIGPSAASEALSSASIHLSTVSADIDSIPTDEFGTVFAGGIAVMLGGVLSALVVGFLLDSGDNYASVVADSYEGRLTEGDIMADEAFWSKLTPEQQEEAKRLLGKVKESKEKGGTGLPLVGDREEEVATPAKEDFAPVLSAAANASPGKASQQKEVSMFDDYE